MHKQNFSGTKGTIHFLTHTSACLQKNPWNDPYIRQVGVYTPPNYRTTGDPYPLLVDLVGYHGTGLMHCGAMALKENVPERVDRLIAEGKMPPAIILFPDCFTWFGGNQYINSASVGPYQDYLMYELIPWVESQFNTYGDRNHRGVFGKSSGGYGAVVNAMQHPDFWGAFACHSGDMGFDYMHRSRFPILLNELRKYNDNPVALVQAFWDQKKPSWDLAIAMEEVGQAAFYHPNEKDSKSLHLPFTDLYTGEVDEDAWEKWLEKDPIHMVHNHLDALKSLKLIYMDCGSSDQCFMQYGMRQFSKILKQHDIQHTYEEFEDNHTSIDYRMDESLPKLTQALLMDLPGCEALQ